MLRWKVMAILPAATQLESSSPPQSEDLHRQPLHLSLCNSRTLSRLDYMASSQSLHAGSSTMNRLNEKQARLEQRLAQIQLISGELPKLIHPGRIKEGDTAYWGSGGLQLPSWSQTRGDASFACVSWSASLTSRPRQLISPDAGAPPIAGLPCGQVCSFIATHSHLLNAFAAWTVRWRRRSSCAEEARADQAMAHRRNVQRSSRRGQKGDRGATQGIARITAQASLRLYRHARERLGAREASFAIGAAAQPVRLPASTEVNVQWAASEMPASMSGPRQRRKPLHHDEDHLPMHAHAPLAESYTPGAMSKSLVKMSLSFCFELCRRS